MPRAILNVEKTIVFAVSFNIASSLTDINQRSDAVMHDMTLFTLCQYQVRHLQMRSSPLTRSSSVWQIDRKIGFIYLHALTRYISSAPLKYIHSWLHPDNPSYKDQGSNASESLRVYFHVLLHVLNNKNCPSSPSSLSFLSPFHLTVLRHKGPDGKQWQYFYPCAVSAWPVLWPDLMSPRTTFSPPPKSHLGNNLPTVQDPIIMQSY